MSDTKENKKRVFLGGTCADSTWRDELIKQLKEIDYFNPVVKDWTEEAQKRELKERKICDFVLYMLTPKMESFYSVAEVVDDSHKRPEKTVFCFLLKDDKKEFSTAQLKSMKALVNMLQENGVKCFKSLDEVGAYLNKKGGQ